MISRGRHHHRIISTCIGRTCHTRNNKTGQQIRKVAFHWCGNRSTYLYAHATANILSSLHSCRLSASFLSTFSETYVHPLSQIVLEHLQSRHSHWVKEMGLDTGLELNKDGTFLLRFPSPVDNSNTASNVVAQGASSPEDVPRTNGSIWTTYEPDERKHYLCISRGGLVGRYMLQDNARPAWHSDRRSTPERVHDAVDEMIEKMHKVAKK